MPTDQKSVEKLVKAVIFDCDGTLVDSEEAHYRAWHKTLQNRNHALSPEIYDVCIGRSDQICAQFFAEMIDDDSPEKMLDEKNQYFHELQLKGLPPIQHTVNFVRLLFQKKEELGLKLGVASAARKEEILRNLQNLGIEKCFDIILSGQDDLAEYIDPEGVNKPKPYVYLHAAKLLGISPKQCVAIEDSNTGATAAVKAGYITIAVPTPYTKNHDLSHASFKIDSFAGVGIDQFFHLVTKK